jgi:hypothetical protein
VITNMSGNIIHYPDYSQNSRILATKAMLIPSKHLGCDAQLLANTLLCFLDNKSLSNDLFNVPGVRGS